MGNILAQTVSNDVEMKLLWNCPHESERIPLPTKATLLSTNVLFTTLASWSKTKRTKGHFLFYFILFVAHKSIECYLVISNGNHTKIK